MEAELRSLLEEARVAFSGADTVDAVEALRVRLGLAASQPPTVVTAWPERVPGAVSVPAVRAPSSA